MHRRNFLVAAGGGLAAGTAGCLSSAQTADETTTGTTISVSGTGEVTAPPDVAELSIAVVERGPDPAAIGTALAERSTTLRTAILEAGISDEDLRTSQYRIDQNRGEETVRGVYQFTITVREIEAVGEIIDTALAAGADDIDRVQYTLAETTRAELREQALRAAIDDARETAATIATKQGLTIDRVIEISTASTRVGPITREGVAVAADTAGTTIDEDNVTVRVSVEASYQAS